MDKWTFLGGVTVGVVVTLLTDFLRPWVNKLNRVLERWIDARGYERDRRRAVRRR